MSSSLFRRPSAFVPLLLSTAALLLLGGYVATHGLVPEPGGDEGTAARLFQLLMVAQVPLIGWFAVRWLPGQPREGWKVLALQLALVAVAVLAVMGFEAAAR